LPNIPPVVFWSLTLGILGKAFFLEKKMTVYEQYEALKQQYMQRHPDATCDEYEAAMAAICEVVGL
jgi:hypothetical protein